MIYKYKQPIYTYVITLHNIYYTNIYIGKIRGSRTSFLGC